MAIASPTVQVAALAAFNPPDSYIAPALFPRCPIPGAAMKPGENTFTATAFRAEKNNNRNSPGELSLEMVPGRRPNTIQSEIEDYPISSKVYHVDEPVSDYALPTLKRFGFDNYIADVATPKIISTLLQDRERRVAAVLANTSNFGGNSANSWANDAIDPMDELDTATQSILLNFGTFSPEQGHELVLALSRDAWLAFRNNPKVRARFKITEDSPVMPNEMSGYIAKTLAIGDNPIPVRIRIATATDGGGANIGQTFAPAFIISNKAALVVSARSSTIALTSVEKAAALQLQADAELRYRSWGRGYSMLDPTISTVQFEDTVETVTRGAHATSDSIFDATGGYVWTGPATVS